MQSGQTNMTYNIMDPASKHRDSLRHFFVPCDIIIFKGVMS